MKKVHMLRLTYFLLFFCVLLVSFHVKTAELYAFTTEKSENVFDINSENKERVLYAGNFFEDVINAVGEGIKQGINEGLKSGTEQPKQGTQQEEPQQRRRKNIADMSEGVVSDTNYPAREEPSTSIQTSQQECAQAKLGIIPDAFVQIGSDFSDLFRRSPKLSDGAPVSTVIKGLQNGTILPRSKVEKIAKSYANNAGCIIDNSDFLSSNYFGSSRKSVGDFLHFYISLSMQVRILSRRYSSSRRP